MPTAQKITRPAPTPMPVGREHYALKKPADLVALMTPLAEQELDNADFLKHLEAQFDEHAVTGKVILDRDRAVAMVMKNAPGESLLRQEKASTLIKVLRQTMRKFIEVGGETITEDE